MPDLLRQPPAPPPVGPSRPQLPKAPTQPDERAARRSLLRQIEGLEGELSSLFVSSWPRKGLEFSVPGRGGPRLLLFDELEELRDDLALKVEDARRRLGDRTYVEDLHRRLIEEMLLRPEDHKWVRVRNEDIGEPGCKSWHVRPRWGPLGLLLNWWRVKISSGCPLAEGRGRRPRPIPRGAALGRRSRKRGVETGEAPERGAGSRAERDAARRARAARAREGGGSPRPRRRPGRTTMQDRPPALWAPFPLTELLTLAGIVLMAWGLLSGGDDGNARIAAGLAVASLGGLELSIREHVTGFRSHTTLLASVAAAIVVAVLVFAAGVEVLGVLALTAIAVGAGAFWALRELFRRRSGGLSFR